METLAAGLLTSNTARQLLSALATYNVLALALSATPLVVLPLGALGKSAAFKVSITLPAAISIILTELSLALATYNNFPLGDNSISLGLSPTFISPDMLPAATLYNNTLSQPQQLINNVFLFGDNKQVNASPGNFTFDNSSFDFKLNV